MTLLNNTFYYDAEIDRLFYATEADHVIAGGPWGWAHQVIIEPKNSQVLYHLIIPGDIHTVGRVIKPRVRLMAAKMTLAWMPVEKINIRVKILFSLYLEVTRKPVDLRNNQNKIGLIDVLTFKKELLSEGIDNKKHRMVNLAIQ